MGKRISRKQTIIVASTLFGMFFGAGNLIFPVHLGQLAGSNAWGAIIGFIVTAVGIPILGVAAIGSSHSDGLQELSSKVGKGYGYFFTCLLYLTIGPFFAIPRCATTSITVGFVQMMDVSNATLLVISAVFFGLVMFFSLRPNGITTWIGKIINPVFLTFLMVMVVVSLLNPGASISDVVPAESYTTGAFFNGFIEGYGTMDAIAGLAFGITIIDIIRKMGVDDDGAVAKDVLKSGVYTGLLMAGIYVLTIIMGAQSRGIFETSANGGVALAQLAQHYFGKAGSIILAVTITFACLKTAIGLVTSCSQTFAKMFPGKFTYNAWVTVITAFSFVVSNVGLNAIISYSIPVLMFIYPLAITLIALSLCGKHFGNDRCVYRWVTGFAIPAAIIDAIKTLPMDTTEFTAFFSEWLPLFDLGLGWLVPSLIGLAIGLTQHYISNYGKSDGDRESGCGEEHLCEKTEG